MYSSQTVYEPNYMSIIHWPDWFKSKLRFAVDSVSLMYEEPMLSVLKKGNKIRKDKLKELHRLYKNYVNIMV